MQQQQSTPTQQIVPSISSTVAPPIVPIDPKPIAQSETVTAVILAVAILLWLSIGSITQLVQVILTAHKSQ